MSNSGLFEVRTINAGPKSILKNPAQRMSTVSQGNNEQMPGAPIIQSQIPNSNMNQSSAMNDFGNYVNQGRVSQQNPQPTRQSMPVGSNPPNQTLNNLGNFLIQNPKINTVGAVSRQVQANDLHSELSAQHGGKLAKQADGSYRILSGETKNLMGGVANMMMNNSNGARSQTYTPGMAQSQQVGAPIRNQQQGGGQVLNNVGASWAKRFGSTAAPVQNTQSQSQILGNVASSMANGAKQQDTNNILGNLGGYMMAGAKKGQADGLLGGLAGMFNRNFSAGAQMTPNDNKVTLIKDEGDIKVYRHYTVCGSELSVGDKILSDQLVAGKQVADKKNQEVKQLLTGHYSADVDSNPMTTTRTVEITGGDGRKRMETIKTTVAR